MSSILRIVPLVLAAALAWGEETLEDKVAATDMTSADQVFALANWCKDHRLPTKAGQYYKQVLTIDKDHDGARAALGYVHVGDRWVPKQYAPPGAGTAKPGGEAAAEPQRALVPGPKASEIPWDLTVPEDPESSNGFITKYVERLPTVNNDSNEMDVSVATCIDPKYWHSALPRLCKALLRPDFSDLYGASSMVLDLARKDRLEEARPLVGFMVKASDHVSDPEDLECFCYAIAVFKDRRAVPRLIELMEHGSGSVPKAAAQAIAQIASLPAADLTVDKAQAWWDMNHNVSEREGLRAQLRSADLSTALEAAKSLYKYRDHEIVPVLLKALRSDDIRQRRDAIGIITKITGDNWGFDPEGDPTIRTKVATRLDEWWKQEKDRFEWRGDSSASSTATSDPLAELVNRLDSTEGTKSQEAETELRGRGEDAVPALIAGLSSPGSIARRKCNELLRDLTKQDFGFDARGTDDERAKAVLAWKAWWAEKHPPVAQKAPAKDEAPAATETAPSGGQPSDKPKGPGIGPKAPAEDVP
jgi:hypothetical protein